MTTVDLSRKGIKRLWHTQLDDVSIKLVFFQKAPKPTRKIENKPTLGVRRRH